MQPPVQFIIFRSFSCEFSVRLCNNLFIWENNNRIHSSQNISADTQNRQNKLTISRYKQCIAVETHLTRTKDIFIAILSLLWHKCRLKCISLSKRILFIIFLYVHYACLLCCILFAHVGNPHSFMCLFMHLILWGTQFIFRDEDENENEKYLNKFL